MIVGSTHYGMLITIRALPGCRPFAFRHCHRSCSTYTSLRTCGTTHSRLDRFVESPSAT